MPLIRTSQGFSKLFGLALNALIWPGLGTMVEGRWEKGLLQSFLFLLGLFGFGLAWLVVDMLGTTPSPLVIIAPLLFVAAIWGWAVFSSVKPD